MAPGPDTRGLILARRARFVAAALCGIAGCGEPTAQAPVRVAGPTGVGGAPGASTADAVAQAGQGGGPLAVLDGGSADEPDAGATVVVRVCLSIIQPPKVSFARGSAKPSAESASTLDLVAKVLRDYPERCVEIEGHTEVTERPSIAQARADAVRSLLTERGIDGARLSATSAGSTKPLAPSSTAAGRAHNRRIEFRLQDCPGPTAPSTSSATTPPSPPSR